MTLKESAQTAYAAIKTLQPDLVVTVIYNGQTCEGTRTPLVNGTDLSVSGEKGMTSGQVRVSAADLAKPDKGKTITVDGVDSFVTNVQTDGVEAFYMIDFTNQRPVEFSSDDIQ